MIRTCACLLLVSTLAVAGCDTLAPDDGYRPAGVAAESDKLQHWELVGGIEAAAHGAVGDSIGLVVTFRGSVSDPEAATDSAFHGHEVRRRTYYRDSFTGVSVLVAVTDLLPVLTTVTSSPLVAAVEPDLSILQSLPLVSFINHTILQLTYTLSEWFILQVRPWSVRDVGGHQSWTVSGNGNGAVDVDVYLVDGPVQHHDINVVERVNLRPEGVGGAVRHGTHVAGIIGAVDDGNGIVGIAPGARIHSLEVLAEDGSTTMTALLDAVELVVRRRREDPSRPLVLNLSVGRDIETMRLNALDRAVAQAVASGVIVIVSAGNDGENATTVSPAHAPGVITVGATQRNGSFASFSNWGSSVDVLAPGKDVLSVSNGGLYATMSGTSMAAAHVAGAAALFVARYPTATAEDVLAHVTRLSRDASAVPSGMTRALLDVSSL